MLLYVGAGVVFTVTLILAYLTGKRSASDELAATLLETSKKVCLYVHKNLNTNVKVA